jgi:hypothetical protein
MHRELPADPWLRDRPWDHGRGWHRHQIVIERHHHRSEILPLRAMSLHFRTKRFPTPGAIEPDFARSAGELESALDAEPSGRRADAALLVYAAILAWPVSVIAEMTGLTFSDIPAALGFHEYWTALGIIAAAGVALRRHRT